MPALRSTLLMPDDSEKLDKLSAVMTALTTDPDADVAAAARAVAGEFQSQPVRKKNEAPPGADAAAVAFEAADKKKTAEESDMGMSADEIERYGLVHASYNIPKHSALIGGSEWFISIVLDRVPPQKTGHADALCRCISCS